MKGGRGRDALTLASGTLLSRILGFARDLLFAHLLGPAADAFLVAFRLPNMARRLLAEGSLGLSYGAAAGRVLAVSGPQALAALGRAVMARLMLLALPCALLLPPLAGPLALLLAPGLDPDRLEHAAHLLRLCMLYLPCAVLAAFAYAHLAALGNCRPQATASALFNVSAIAAGLAAPLLFSPGPQFVSRAEWLLCLGVVAAGIIQAVTGMRAFLAVDSPGAAKPGMRPNPGDYAELRPGPPGNSVTEEPPGSAPGNASLWSRFKEALRSDAPEARALLRSLPRNVAGASPHLLHLIAATALASFLAEGGISALYFAERLVELPLGLFGAAAGLAALPILAADAAQGRHEALRRTLGRGVRLTAFFSLPATAGLFALALPLCSLLFGHGAYDENAVRTTARALEGFCLGLPALCASRLLLSAANALGRSADTLRCALYSLAPLALISLPGILLSGSAGAGARWLGLGLAAGAWANAALLLRLVNRTTGAPPGASPLEGQHRTLGRYAAAATGMAVLLMALHAAAGPFSAPLLLLLVAACAALWGGAALLLRNEDALLLWREIRGK